MRRLQQLFILVLLAHGPSAYAQTLLEDWQKAQKNDPSLRAAQKEDLIAQALRMQMDALWKPSLVFYGTAGATTRYSITRDAKFAAPGFSASGAKFETWNELAAMGQASIQWMQPLHDPKLRQRAEQLKLSAEAVGLSETLAQQRLLAGLIENTLAFTQVTERWRFAQRQVAVMQKTFEEISKRQRLGDATLTDRSEAFERLQSAKASLSGIEAAGRVHAEWVADVTGRETRPRILSQGLSSSLIKMDTIETYVQAMKTSHPQLKLLRLERDIARAQAAQFLEGEKAMTVQAVASAQQELVTSRDILPFGYQAGSAFVGLQLSIPLSTGGRMTAQEREWLARADVAEENHQAMALVLERGMRDSWYGYWSAAERLPMLEQAMEAGAERLRQTQKSYRVGARTILELLGAETDHIEAQRLVFETRLSLLTYRSRLSAAMGTLDESDIDRIDRFLR
ncbi:MAG: TolC family protein [Burkholderiaceae bacterium]